MVFWVYSFMTDLNTVGMGMNKIMGIPGISIHRCTLLNTETEHLAVTNCVKFQTNMLKQFVIYIKIRHLLSSKLPPTMLIECQILCMCVCVHLCVLVCSFHPQQSSKPQCQHPREFYQSQCEYPIYRLVACAKLVEQVSVAVMYHNLICSIDIIHGKFVGLTMHEKQQGRGFNWHAILTNTDIFIAPIILIWIAFSCPDVSSISSKMYAL